MRVLVTGASGFIGSHVVAALLRAGHEVSGCVRSPVLFRDSVPGRSYVAGDFSRDHALGDWLPRLTGIDAVVNCVGIIREQGSQTFDALHRDAPVALFKACARAGIRKVVQISALGADDAAVSHYHRSKKAADDTLASLTLRWVILQPSIVYGPGAKSSLFFRALAALPVVPLVGNGEHRVQPVHIDDLVEVILKSLEGDALNGLRFPVLGPVPISMKDLLLAWRSWLGLRPARFLSFPYSVASLGAQLFGFLGLPANGDAVRMLLRGNTGDGQRMRAVLGRAPSSIATSLALTPMQQSDFWHARLYFLLPGLRISLALVWVLTGLISAFVYPVSDSYQLLARLGIRGALAPIALYGAAALDLLLGVALLLSWRVPLVGTAQITIMFAYLILISVGLPEYWVHPFGPITKNVPLIVATLLVIATDQRR